MRMFNNITNRKVLTFAVRWASNSFGIWISLRLLGTGYDNIEPAAGVLAFLSAGLVFSLANSFIKPILVTLSFPLILVTLGLFMLVVNGVLVYYSLLLAPGGISMTFQHSIIAGLILGLINYIVSTSYDMSYLKEMEKENEH